MTEVNYAFPGLTYITLRFRLVAEAAFRLPVFKGSLLRGGLGNSLRRAVCIMSPKDPCAGCLVKGQCVYTQVFETLILKDPPPYLRRSPMAPKPFVIDCRDENRDYRQGDTLAFDLKLFGNAATYCPFVIHAVQQMAARGLGIKRSRFFLESVACRTTSGAWKAIYNGQNRTLHSQIDTLSPDSTPPPEFAERLTIHFLTPTRVKVNGKLRHELSFSRLTFILLRRLLEIAHFYTAATDLNWEFQSLMQAASNIVTENTNLQWKDHYRYSARQKTDMLLGGFIGKIDYRGDLRPFVPLLKVGEVLHIGKGTTFGLGKVGIEAG